jgi:hypothetical protein
MSAPVSEGVQDDDDILGFPGDGFVDKTDTNPGVLGEQDEEGDDTRIDETGGASSLGSDKKRKKTVVVSPDGFVVDRIKKLKQKITGSNREDNEWTKMLRAKLVQRRTTEMELVWSTLRVGSVRNTVRQTPVSSCVGVCLHERIPQSVREKRKRLERNHGSLGQGAWHFQRYNASSQHEQTEETLYPPQVTSCTPPR